MVETIRSELTGSDALGALDRAAERTRGALAQAVTAADDAEARRNALAEKRISGIRALSEIRLDLIENGAAGPDLDAAHREARHLLQQHAAFVAREAERIEVARQAISALEAERAEAARARDAAIEAHEARVAEVEHRLREDPGYLALVKASEEASAVAARAEQKLDIAEADREQKGRPYEADPLFSYLWKRKFRTPAYKASPLFRFLDGWVASLCDYDRHWTNFQRLTELPERLAEHVARVEAAEQAALARLDAAEAGALKAAGADALAAEIEDRRRTLAQCDARIEAAEAEHRERVKAHEAARTQQAGPAIAARQTLDAALAAASFPELRVLAAQTLTLDDDRLVDELVRLRSEELALELSARDIAGLPERRRFELERLEALRARFKAAGLDTPWVMIAGASLQRALDALTSGEIGPEDALGVIKRGARRASARGGQDVIFGGRTREAGGQMGDLLGQVLIEVARQAARHRGVDFGGGPWGGSSPGRRTSMPRPRPTPSRPSGGGRKGGGFRTGGGF